MIFAEKLKMLRKQAGRSQEKLAEKLVHQAINSAYFEKCDIISL